MEFVAVAAAWAISSVCQNIPPDHWLATKCPTTEGDAYILTERLSSNAAVHYPGSDIFARSTNRWSASHAPNISVVAVPAVEGDVVEIVKYANENNMPFLVYSGGHGSIESLGKMQNGIEIWMDQLSGVDVSEDGTSARIGGGTLSKTVTDSLWGAGKQTVTGGCECTSFLGPGLGGGHGVLQGNYGLIADQFLSMNIALANGTLQTIDKDSDLWWAMQGAGHNFGIVTSVTAKIYDIKHRDWAHASFIFTDDKVEALYEAINSHLMPPPPDVTVYGFFLYSPDIHPKPVIFYYLLQEGVTIVDPIYTQPFQDLGPTGTDAGNGDYRDIPRWVGWDLESLPCQHSGLANVRYPIDIEKYDVQAMRQVHDLFASATQETPALNGSFFLFEGYPVKGVQAVPSESTAFPFRGDKLLLAPVLSYKPAGPELDKKAADLGNQLRHIIHKATGREELHSYVNYAAGDETKQSWYGYEEWRQEKLLALKNKYDPDREFSFYAPIA
ncbi:hypothetical protein M426DRAFT_61219 [Hypoxylon sp. CI-4A]|nr:hypothetical protein M426DRAFT_61219 [Hypoxylon sp. CI-4A]